MGAENIDQSNQAVHEWMERTLTLHFMTNHWFIFWIVVMSCIPLVAGAIAGSGELTLAREGKAVYRIVEADNATSSEKTAARELQKYLQQVTGASFTVVGEAEAADDGPRIFVGAGSSVKALLPDQDWDALGTDGIVVRSVGEDLILAGGRPRGTLYAVYEFLEEAVGCRFWTPTESLIPNRPTLTVPAWNTTFIPPFMSMRQHNATAIVENPQFATMMREVGPYVEQDATWGGRYHQLRCAFVDLLPVEKHFEAHPEWYSDARNGDLPCTPQSRMPASHATWQMDVTNPEVVEAFAAAALAKIAADPNVTTLAVWANDNQHYCKCDNCLAVIREHGTPAALMLQFANQVAERVHAVYPDLPVEMQAYWWTIEPPKSMRAAPNVLVDVALIGADFGHRLDSEWNRKSRDILAGWSKVSSRLHVWYYVTNFRWSLFPHPNWHALGPDLRYFAANNVTGIYEQGNTHSGGAGDFIQLRAWLLAKLMWDPSRDSDALMDEFMQGYYGAAAPHLRQYLELVRDAYLKEERWLGPYNTRFTFFTLDVTNRALELFRDAAKAVEGDAVLSDRVRRERLSLDAVIIAKFNYLHYQSRKTGTPFIGPDDLDQAIATFEETAKRFGVTNFRESAITEGPSALENGIADMRSRLKPGAEVPLPEFARKYPVEDVIDFQPRDIYLYARGTLADVVDDPAAAGGKAAMSVGNTNELVIQVRVGPYLPSHHWRVHVSGRVEAKPGAALQGVGFKGGVKDQIKHKMAFVQDIPLDRSAGSEYRLFDLGVHELNGGNELQFGPANNPNVDKVFIERVILIREEPS